MRWNTTGNFQMYFRNAASASVAAGFGITPTVGVWYNVIGTFDGSTIEIYVNGVKGNNASLAGHVIVDDYAVLGAFSGVHQFCRIGKHSMTGAMSGIDSDVIPYGTVFGNRAHLSGLNIIGLKRRGFTKQIIQELRKAYGLLFSSQDGTLLERIKEVSEEFSKNEPVTEWERTNTLDC